MAACSRASAGSTWGWSGPGSRSGGNARLTPSAGRCSADTGQGCPATPTCETLAVASGLSLSSSCAEGSPASRSASPVSGEELETPAGCGPSSSDAFAFYDPESCSWRMCQASVLGGWETFWEAWPRAGMTLSGMAYQRLPLVPRTSVIESGLWPTPTQADGLGGAGSSGRDGGLNLRTAVGPGGLNPAWVEWLLGFPSGWTG